MLSPGVARLEAHRRLELLVDPHAREDLDVPAAAERAFGAVTLDPTANGR